MKDLALMNIRKIDRQIEEGVDNEGLKKLRKKLYTYKDKELSFEALHLKHVLLLCIKEMLEEC